MNDPAINKEPDDPDWAGMSPEQKEKILILMQKMMELGICAMYGQEDQDAPDAVVDCEARLKSCRAICCTFQFALTKEEVQKGRLKHNPSRPFFIAQDAEGYCLHLDHSTLRCTVWSNRPLRCRRYSCKEDARVQEGKVTF